MAIGIFNCVLAFIMTIGICGLVLRMLKEKPVGKIRRRKG